ncbi:MAG: DedA family protein, partial [Pseudomonadota bacterium]
MENLAIQQVIADYGYWALFVGTFLEGETFFLLGGIAARQGMLNPWGVALAALGGGFIGDQIFFLLGRWRGVELMASSRRLARKAVKARALVRRHALALVLLSRFLYGFRMVIPLACGTSGVHWLTFLTLNFASAVAWTLVFGGLGYLFGGWVTSHMDFMAVLPKL